MAFTHERWTALDLSELCDRCSIKIKYSPDTPWWILRERIRFCPDCYSLVGAAAPYTSIPSQIAKKLDSLNSALDYHDHALHMSLDNLGCIAFTENPEKGEQDRQLRMKFGRYLKRYASEYGLSDEEIAELAGTFNNIVSGSILKIATEPDDIEWVYVHGPNSCMSGNKKWGSNPHPARVYGGPDTAVAYMEKDGRVTARAVLNLTRKQYSTIYGDDYLGTLLVQEGYTAGDLNGCRLLLIETDSGAIVCPYIDGRNGIVVDGKNGYLVVTDEGEYDADETGGILGPSCYCAICGTTLTVTAAVYSGHMDEYACEDCADQYWVYANLGNGYMDWIHEQSAAVVNGEAWHEDCVTECDNCHAYLLHEDVYPVEIDERTTEDWCPDCVDFEAVEDEEKGMVSKDYAAVLEQERREAENAA